eukprot:scaffold88687_cov72-Phaeocystis_antarctica.AAC.1
MQRRKLRYANAISQEFVRQESHYKNTGRVTEGTSTGGNLGRYALVHVIPPAREPSTINMRPSCACPGFLADVAIVDE